MNLQKAESLAKLRTEQTKISHIVVKTNNEYYVLKKRGWTGDIIKQYDYDIQKSQDIQDMQPIASEGILSNTGNKKPKSTSRKR